MNKKTSKTLFVLSENCRITTKNLSKQIKSSQQSASYLIQQLKKKKLIQGFTAIIDPIKLGFTNVIVGFNYLDFDKQTKKEILADLQSNNNIVTIQEASQGIDILVEFSVYNLSSFNKIHTELLKKHHKALETKFIMPVIVKHKYDHSYLVKKSTDTDKIICGDREVNNLSDDELSVLYFLVKQPDANYTAIFKQIKISIKRIVNIKKKLEKLKIIRGYTCLFNYDKLDIKRDLLFLKLSGRGMGQVDKLTEYAKQNKHIIELTKILGTYQIVLTVESLKKIQLIQELRVIFSIEKYMIANIDRVIKDSYLPQIISEKESLS